MRAKIWSNWSLIISSLVFWLVLTLPAGQALAQDTPWPPFWFDLVPTYASGQLTYKFNLYRQGDVPLRDLSIKIPLPAGTSLLKSDPPAGVNASFDGQAVTFTPVSFDRYIEGTSFTVEVTNPVATVFTTQAHITWNGDRPEDYAAEAVSFDTTRPVLNWNPLPTSRLQLGLKATRADNIITYALYPKAVGRPRMWDLRINIPLPEGTSFVSAEASPPFTANFDGHEATFFILELPQQTDVDPLIFKVSTGNASQPVVTRAEATWKNSSRDAGTVIPAQESLLTNDLVVQPGLPQQAIGDSSNDVPLPGYDLTNVVFQANGPVLDVVFNTAGPMGEVGQLEQYTLFIDSDCNRDTGAEVKYLGAEYRARYNHEAGRASFIAWDATQKDWLWDQPTQLDSQADGQSVRISLPYQLLGANPEFCWVAQASNGTDQFNLNLPRDWLPDGEHQQLTRQEIAPAALVTATPVVASAAAAPAVTPTAAGSGFNMSGVLAVPLRNGQGFYDVHLYSMPYGRELGQIPNARQPNFRFDGATLLTNHESVEPQKTYVQEVGDGRSAVYVLKNYNPAENIYEYNLATGLEKQVSDSASDAYPSYSPWGDKIMYGNPELLAEADQAHPLAMLVQCGLLPPGQESLERCRNLAELGALALPGGGELAGNHPIWSDTNLIAYNGCQSTVGRSACGIFLLDPRATKGFNQDISPTRLTTDASDLPSDAKQQKIAFTSSRDGNPEAYLINVDGSGLINLSQNPQADDGLPTISPDGNWVAFVSNRDKGRWAVWVVPITGGPVRKLFDLPADTPWSSGERAWFNERISWGK